MRRSFDITEMRGKSRWSTDDREMFTTGSPSPRKIGSSPWCRTPPSFPVRRSLLKLGQLLTCLTAVASSVFLPSIPQMAAELHTTAAIIDYTVAIYIVTIGVAPLLWSPLSGFYGRKPIYLASMPIMAVASIGVAQSRNVGSIIGTRILQGFGGSAAFLDCVY